MRRNFKALFLTMILAVVLFLPSRVWSDQQVVVYGDRYYPPYSYLEDGQAKGIYVEILMAAFAQMKDYEVTINMMPWKRGLDAVKEGKAVALFPPYQTKERMAWIDFSEPILAEQIVVFGKSEGLAGKVVWPEDFFGSNFGLNLGFDQTALGGEKFVEACATGKIKVQEANSTEQNLKKLKADRIDFYINDRLANIDLFPSIKRGMVVAENHGHLGFTRKSEAFKFLPDFKKQFNGAIKNLKASKEIDRILKKYLQ